jgi:putative ABC transport system permease protein
MGAALIYALRKIVGNRSLWIPYFAGVLLGVSIASSIPIFTESALTRMIVRDLEQYQMDEDIFPGTISARVDLLEYYSLAEREKLFEWFSNAFAPDQIGSAIGLPVLAHTNHYVRDNVSVLGVDVAANLVMSVESLSGLASYAAISRGRMCSDTISSGVLEAVVTEHTLEKNELILGQTYLLPDITGDGGTSVRLKIVGLYRPRDLRDLFWVLPIETTASSLVISTSAFRRLFVEDGAPSIFSARWLTAVDYRQLSERSVESTIRMHDRQQRLLGSQPFSEFAVPALGILKEFRQRKWQLTVTLMVLYGPILFIVGYLVIMISRLLVEHDANELAVLMSRGASRRQLVGQYVSIGSLIAAAAMLIGPGIGVILCRVMGSANDFLQFVQRSEARYTIRPIAYLYAGGMSIIMFAAMIVPVYHAARQSVVEHKRTYARENHSSAWVRVTIEAGSVALSLFGLFRLGMSNRVLTDTSAEGIDVAIDPLFYLLFVLFALGATMILLRIFPAAVRMIRRLGERLWPPELYASLTIAARSTHKNRMMMFFLSFSICLGILGVASGRTINANVIEKLQYGNGADIVVRQVWEGEQIAPADPRTARTDVSLITQPPVLYREPPFHIYRDLDGIQAAARVFRRPDTTVRGPDGDRVAETTVMGIVPDEFARVAWFRPDLLPRHHNEYLNALADNPRAALLSISLRESLDLGVGDTVFLTWPGQGYTEMQVYGFIEYWPSFNPKQRIGDRPRGLMVANLGYLHSSFIVEPYEVWMRMAPAASSGNVYRQLEDQHIALEYIRDTRQDTVRAKNDPLLQGINGAMTLGFLSLLMVATAGNILHWTISLRTRAPQLGVVRALGLSRVRVMLLLLWEQCFLFGFSTLVGSTVGAAASRLFVPVFQLAFDAQERVPPFRVAALRSDYNRLFLLLLAIMIASVLVFHRLVARLRVTAAIKLGED